MRGRIRAGAIGLGCAGLAVLTLVTPAAGERTAPDQGCDRGCQMPGGDVGGDCQDASMSTPRAEAGAVKLTADVHDGASVAPGQDILIRLSWDPKKWSGTELDRALDCVRVKGELAPDLSAEEAPTANDGVYEYRLHVPDDIKPGCDICAEGFVAGDGAGGSGPLDLRSDRYCFMSGRPQPPPAPPVTRPPSPPAPPAPSPPAAAAPTTKSAPARVPSEVGGITAGQPSFALAPAPASPPAVAGAGELPRTGSGAGRAGAAGGGLALCLGGLAVIGGTGRRPRGRFVRNARPN